MATDYDKGKLTDREKQAGKNQNALGKYNDQTLTGAAKYNKNSANTIEKWNEGNTIEGSRRNAANTTQGAEYSAAATNEQFRNQIANYDFANQQNANLRDTEFKQASRKSEAERFEAQRQLQNAALGLLGNMGNTALNSSTTGNLMSMLRDRNDMENSTYWQTLQDNRNQIQNAYDESYNQNQVAKRDAAINAMKSLKDINAELSSNLNNIQTGLWDNLGNLRSDLFGNLSNIQSDLITNRRNLRGDLAANLNNINPNLFPDINGTTEAKLNNELSTLNAKKNKTKADKDRIKEIKEELKNLPKMSVKDVDVNTDGYQIPGSKNNIFDSSYNVYQAPGTNSTINSYINGAQSTLNNTRANNATLLDYIMPANAEQSVAGKRNRLQGNDYFSRLVNGYNNR